MYDKDIFPVIINYNILESVINQALGIIPKSFAYMYFGYKTMKIPASTVLVISSGGSFFIKFLSIIIMYTYELCYKGSDVNIYNDIMVRSHQYVSFKYLITVRVPKYAFQLVISWNL